MARKITRKRARIYGWTSAVGLLLILGATGWVYTCLRLADIPSKSMLPTLRPGDIVTNRIDAYRHRMPRRGEITIFHDKDDGGLLIKRVIGEPGEAVTVWSGRVWIGGQRLVEPYVIGKLILERPQTLTLEDDEVWVMGDNRDFSDDSRDFGPVKQSQLVGRAAAMIWPFARRHRLDAPVPVKAAGP